MFYEFSGVNYVVHYNYGCVISAKCCVVIATRNKSGIVLLAFFDRVITAADSAYVLEYTQQKNKKNKTVCKMHK